MLHNIKPDSVMLDCLAEAEQGESIYTKQQEEEIRLIIHTELRKGKDFNRIYEKNLKEEYELPHGNGLFASYARLRDIYAEEVKKWKKEVQTDKEAMFGQLYNRYQELFYNELDKHDIVGQKKVLDSLMRLLTISNQERALEQAKDTDGVEYHLDFSL